ncbi:MAG: methyltransferase domain-containing protein [Alphaproteobacteria bacterium]|nr:methyltransferase domain-containing protein [Alphaproteobacteria bacterium]
MGFYDRYILPPLLNSAMGAKPITYQRRKVVPQAEGEVLEIGMGAGHNLAHYDKSKVTRLIGLEPHPKLRERAAARAAEAGLKVEFTGLKAEDIDLPPASVDTVVVTYTFCTIPDVPRAMSAIGRVMRPGAKLLFCEHGLAPDEKVQAWQRRIEPFWKRIAGGCHLCRPIPQLLKEGGFAVEAMETMYLPGTPRFAGFNYWGRAVRA